MTLVVEDLHFAYNEGAAIVRGLNLELGDGQRIALSAPSGAGKTTVCQLMAGYLRPDSGRVLLDGKPLPRRAYCPVQMIWQHPEKSVNPLLRMKTVLAEGDRIDPQVISGLGIEDAWLERYPTELSGGEIQRFCIARALGAGTRYLIADEITTMLDAVSQAAIWRFLLRETKRRGIGMLIVTHGPALSGFLTDHQVVLA